MPEKATGALDHLMGLEMLMMRHMVLVLTEGSFHRCHNIIHLKRMEYAGISTREVFEIDDTVQRCVKENCSLSFIQTGSAVLITPDSAIVDIVDEPTSISSYISALPAQQTPTGVF